MASADPIITAVDILSDYPAFSTDFRDVEHFNSRLVLPRRAGHLRVVESDKGRVLYSWSRLPEPIFHLPRAEDWRTDGDMFWICDMVWDKGITARDAVRIAQADLFERNLIEDGERVYFWRGVSERFGSGIARKESA